MKSPLSVARFAAAGVAVAALTATTLSGAVAGDDPREQLGGNDVRVAALTVRPLPPPGLPDADAFAQEQVELRERQEQTIERLEAEARAKAEAEARARAEAEAARKAEAARRARAAAAPARASGSVWDRLAMCESSGNWASSVGTYEGGLQFHPRTWDAYKPAGYPDAAYQATREQQILVAEKVLARQGWGAWPACSRKLGLR